MLLSPSLDYPLFFLFLVIMNMRNDGETHGFRRNVCRSWIADLMHKDCVYWKGRVGIWNVNLLKVLRNSLIQKHLTMFTSFISVIETSGKDIYHTRSTIYNVRSVIYDLWSMIYDLRTWARGYYFRLLSYP